MANVLRGLKILEVSGVGKGANDGCRIVICKRADGDERDTGMDKITKAHSDWNAEVRRVMDEKHCTMSKAIDVVCAARPELFTLAKAATAVLSTSPRSNMTQRSTPTAKPSRMDNEPDADDAALFADAVDEIMREKKVTRSQAIDVAMRMSGPRSHYDASLKKSLAANR